MGTVATTPQGNPTATQTVKLFNDMDRTGQQEVIYYPEDDFMSVLHNGHEINLSRENWDKLIKLAALILPLKS